MNKLIFVTGNDNKAREAAAVLGVDVKRVKLELEELQSMDLRVIVEHKARQAYAKVGEPLFIEDVALDIEQWKGFPGPLVRWINETIGFDNLPSVLKKGSRAVTWTVMVGYFDGQTLHSFSASEKGSIALAPRGTDGFGFDRIFIPRGHTKTVAELGEAIKNKQSARYLAFKKLRHFLSSRG